MKYRIQYTKTGLAAFLGHLELMNVLRRAFRRAGLPLRYSEGFHPHARLSFGKALGIGIESECEFCDVELLAHLETDQIANRLKNVFPEGIEAVSVIELGTDSRSIEASISATRYIVEGMASISDIEAVKKSVLYFNNSNGVPFARLRGKSSVNVDLKDFISKLVVESEGVIGLTLNEREPMIRVSEALSGIFGISERDFHRLKIRKMICQMNLS